MDALLKWPASPRRRCLLCARNRGGLNRSRGLAAGWPAARGGSWLPRRG